MNRELRDKWCHELRYGNLSQGEGALRCDGKYCCLGVLCNIVDPDAWSEPSCGDIEYNDVFYYTLHDADSKILPTLLREHLGITVEEQCYIIQMNDNGRTFNEITDYIEEFL